MEKDPYDGRFLIDEKLEDVVRDLLAVLEKWKLRTMEQQIALQQATQFVEQQKLNKINESRVTDMKSTIDKISKKFGIDRV